MIGDNEGIKDDCLAQVRGWATSMRAMATNILAQNTTLGSTYTDQNLTDAFASDKSTYETDRDAITAVAQYILDNVPEPKGN